MKKIVFPLVWVLLLAGCSPGKKLTIDTVYTASGDIHRLYPDELYLVRYGMGETPEQAAESARFEIVKYFESRISGGTLVHQWAKIRTTRGKTIEERLTEISNTIIVSAEREIPGIDIVKTERAKNSTKYEAWAVLRKSTYSSILRERIEKIDREVDNWVTISYDNDLYQTRSLAKVIRALMRREPDRLDLMLIAAGLAIDSRVDVLYAVMTSLDSLIIGALDIGIIFTGNPGGRIKAGIIKGVVDAGIRLK